MKLSQHYFYITKGQSDKLNHKQIKTKLTSTFITCFSRNMFLNRLINTPTRTKEINVLHNQLNQLNGIYFTEVTHFLKHTDTCGEYFNNFFGFDKKQILKSIATFPNRAVINYCAFGGITRRNLSVSVRENRLIESGKKGEK